MYLIKVDRKEKKVNAYGHSIKEFWSCLGRMTGIDFPRKTRKLKFENTEIGFPQAGADKKLKSQKAIL